LADSLPSDEDQGKARHHRYSQAAPNPKKSTNRTNRMSNAYAIALGVLAGIVLFFVLQRMGVIDRWFDKMDR
jgi:hypothetical protein